MNSGGGRAIEKPFETRESGFYWVFIHRAKHVTIARWQDFTNTWLVTGNDIWLEDGELTVLSSRLRPPEVNEGWPAEFTASSPEELRARNIRWD